MKLWSSVLCGKPTHAVLPLNHSSINWTKIRILNKIDLYFLSFYTFFFVLAYIFILIRYYTKQLLKQFHAVVNVACAAIRQTAELNLYIFFRKIVSFWNVERLIEIFSENKLKVSDYSLEKKFDLFKTYWIGKPCKIY